MSKVSFLHLSLKKNQPTSTTESQEMSVQMGALHGILYLLEIQHSKIIVPFLPTLTKFIVSKFADVQSNSINGVWMHWNIK